MSGKHKDVEEKTPDMKKSAENIKALSEELQKEKEKAENYYNQLISLKAEFDNYRKRLEKESSRMAAHGRTSAVKELLPVMDNILRYEEAAVTGEDTDVGGLELIVKDMKRALQGLGLKVMDCMGKEFSPHNHEAVFREKTDDYQHNSIIKVVSNGYYLGDEMIKPAMVAVAENVPEKESGEEENASNDGKEDKGIGGK